jgi:hypothetical protein
LHISPIRMKLYLYPNGSRVEPPSEVRSFLSITLKLMLLGGLICLLVIQIHAYSRLVVPTKVLAKPADCVEETLLSLGAPARMVSELAHAVRSASIATDVPKELLIALLYTESTFDPDAVSKKGYKGLMQTPHKVPYTDASVLIGARILKDKIRLADGNIDVAVAMYKGGKDKPQAQRQAAYTMSLYRKLEGGQTSCPGTGGG